MISYNILLFIIAFLFNIMTFVTVYIRMIPLKKLFHNVYQHNKIEYNNPKYGYGSYGVAIYMLDIIEQASIKFGFQYTLFYGALIGLARFGDLLPNDHDIEIRFISKKDQQIFNSKECQEYLENHDLIKTKDGICYKGYSFPIIETGLLIFDKEQKYLLFTDKSANSYLTNENNSFKLLRIIKYLMLNLTFLGRGNGKFTYKLETEHLLPIRKYKLGNITTRVPNNINKILETNYGNNVLSNPHPDFLTYHNFKKKSNRLSILTNIIGRKINYQEYRTLMERYMIENKKIN